MDTKKSPRKNLENKKTLFLEIGFVLVLAFVLLAFQYRITERPDFITPDDGHDWVDRDYIPPNIPKPPPPPPPKSHEITPAPDELINDDFFPEIDIDAYPDVAVPDYPPIDIGGKDEVPDPGDDIILRPEFWPEFPGGVEALYRYLGSVIRYPREAQQLGIEGTVYVGFVIERDGSVTNVHIQRGIGAGCDEEAMKAIANMPNWTPGRMGTQPVRVRFTVPVNFKLNR
ncbi:MAG: energy transducer TonB [Bacteroidales bacterium]|nr:energy transducer TonB [Bacteroidales bacterium]